MNLGTRVCYSEAGMRGRKTQRTGSVVGRSIHPGCVRVLWDGTKHAVAVHESFLKIVNPNLPNDETPTS